MFNLHHKAKVQSALAQVEAIGKSQAVIEFNLDGTIVTANQNFLGAIGYTLDEIKGKHHSMFVDPATRESAAYREFWASLNRGEFQAAQYKRLGKGGSEIWIQASYNPILDANGKPVRVIKFATDITAQKIQSMEDAGKIAAIGRAQAVIEFNMDGTIVTANENFLRRDGLLARRDQGQASQHVRGAGRPRQRGLSRILGQAEPRRISRPAEYKRIGKGGKEVWILATYNPILDEAGKPFKVVKFATDVTAQKLKAADNDGQIAAIGKSQAVIEFNMDGTIRTANAELPRRDGLLAGGDPGQASQHVRRADRAQCAGLPRSSGRRSIAASTRRPNTSGSPRAAARSGSRRPTTRSSTSTASPSRS